ELTYRQAITPVVHTGDICQNGTFCSLVPVQGAPMSTGDRSLLDFFEVAIDRQGRANIALADNAESPGSLLSAYTRQTSGVSLTTGQPLPVEKVTLPRLVCSPDAAFTDPSGDATEAVVSTPLPNAPALDITRGSVGYDFRKKALVLRTKVLDLSQDPPAGASGEQVEFSFSYHGVGYTAVGSHDATQAKDDFHMESPLRTSVGGALTGTFDKAASEVRIEVPADFFAKLGKGPVVTTGAKLSGLGITTRRNEVGAIVPNADEAGSLGCPFVVGAVAGPLARTANAPSGSTTVPSAVDRRPVPAALPATGLPTGLPLVALGLLLGGGVLLRRRLG
ncbi:MAG: hypothetical protein WCD35_09850, partial [Mycobacteriales bacterium]